MADNTTTLVGTLGADPELRFIPSGQAVANFNMAVTRKWDNRQTGAKEEQTSWFRVNCWGQLGENVAESLTKGARVIVTGRLEQRTWETQEGEKRSVIEVVADSVGPDLRWATASVVRNERQGGGNYTAAPTGGTGYAAPGAHYAAEEEPFICTLDEWDPLHGHGAIPARRLGVK